MYRELLVGDTVVPYPDDLTVEDLKNMYGEDQIDVALSWYLSCSFAEFLKQERDQDKRVEKILYALTKLAEDAKMQFSVPHPATNLPF